MDIEQTHNKEIRRITWIGAVINIFLSSAKIIVGNMAFSQSLIADGVHSLSDLLSDFAVLIGSRYWGNAPDEEHPYGHGRVETLVSLAIAIGLLIVAVEMIRGALIALNTPQVNTPGMLAFVVALISILLKEIIYRWTSAVGNRINSRALIANAWHHRTDAFSSIPVAVAVIGIRIFPEFVYLDQIATILVSLMLIKAAWDISKPNLLELMETQNHENIEQALQELASQYPEIIEIHKVRIRRVGNSHFVEMHVLVEGDTTVRVAHRLTEDIEQNLKTNNHEIMDFCIHIEPNDPEQHLQE